ncbi:carboxypeptidase-like regulatory domain-containing protein [Longimicrobium sp.]|uniref:carboxypeptidase-like regulatory domain-containing protein n=1 Tax=Longimicrobium sp. TaxID=2029185 RepID=UPI002BFCD792|nr:carboxypeptidase-like regulatory domain-containing protein [Longimicrobium sp.]HSU15610.1 carboxypeptidase-like regulatory domain-containing protein [Longimicrobium sp.]
MKTPLSSLQPCGERWDAMERLGDGRRVCRRCERPVTDLRGMSVDEITFVHVMSDEPVCGVYSPGQLRPDAAEAKRCRSGALVTLALGASLLAARADAQTAVAPAPELVQLPADAAARPGDASQPSHAPGAAAAEDTVLYGTVRTKDGTPLPGAAVMVVGTAARAVTDSAGGFAVRVPREHGGKIELRVGRLGYVTRTVFVSAAGNRAGVGVLLEPSAIMLAGLVASADGRGAVEDRAARREGFSVARIEVSGP